MIKLPVFAKAFNSSSRRKSVVTSTDAWTGNTMMANGMYLYLTFEMSKADKTGRIFVACEKFTYAAYILWERYENYHIGGMERVWKKLFGNTRDELPQWDDAVNIRTDSGNPSFVISLDTRYAPKIVLETDVTDDEVDETVMLMTLEYSND